MAKPKHGMSRTRIYRIWGGMIERCENKDNVAYPNYGGRGISISPEMRSFTGFYAIVGDPPSPYHSLDRFPDNNGNYEPGNVRWATATTQARNRRSNRLITFLGKTQTLIEWAEEYHIPLHRLSARISRYKWPIGKALTLGYYQYHQDRKQSPYNIVLAFNGKSQSLSRWSKELQIPYSCLVRRVFKYRWKTERVLTEPSRSRR